MKLKNFDDFVFESGPDEPYKNYNEDMPLEELELGDAVTYRGMRCSVGEKNEGAVRLNVLDGAKIGGRDFVNVNQAMFNQACFVKEKNKKAEE
jgi:hypothetical protein